MTHDRTALTMLLLGLIILTGSNFPSASSSPRPVALVAVAQKDKERQKDPIDLNEGPPVSKDARLFSLIESLSDISPYARQRAVEDLSRIGGSGQGDPRVLSSLIGALDDSDASVRGAAAKALGKLGDPASVIPLRQRMEIEESIYVKASLKQALQELCA